ncbi:MAG: M48 family metallopeptidase [Deltaproteobacteria bacterium]|nr:M48 family metallopeptidase [Deltaproteobacteria bacterium]
MNGYLIFILAVLILSWLLDLALEILNLRALKPDLPAEFQGWYDAGKYANSQQYLRDTTIFGCITDTFFLILTVAFILLGGFNFADGIARSAGFSEIPTGLLFAGMLILASDIIHIPFSAYATFVIEERYGFNKTTLKVFIFDHLKGWLLAAAIGGPVLALVLWFFQKAGPLAWLWCWAAVTVLQIALMFIAPAVIMPLFNKFTPLADGKLKGAIEGYARGQKLKLQGIFTMDGSRRSTKSNAFFTGFGRFRRIVLFDTLIEKHSVEELVAVLAHEVGHYKKRHILRMLVMSVATSGVMFFILSLFLSSPSLSAAFRMEHTSLYATLFFFGFLYAPIEMLIGIGANILSRRHEFEADEFAARTVTSPEPLITALKKLSVDNLSNLTPHPAKVFLEYSHPPVLERIQSLRRLA